MFWQMALNLLSNSDISNPSFKLNISNDIGREIILDKMEILWRSMEILNRLYIENTRHPVVMNSSNSLYNIGDIIIKQHVLHKFVWC